MVGWLITHPLKSTMAHENSVNRWFVDQRTSGLTDVADVGTFIGQTLTGAVVLVVLGVVLRGVEAHLVAAGLRRRPRRRARPVLPRRHDARPAAAPAGPHPAVGLTRPASFPSGRTGTAVGIAFALAALLWAYTRVPAALLVVLVAIPVWTMLARLYVGAHHVSDVLTEFVLASLWIWACARLLLPARAAAPDRAATRAEAATAA